MKTIYKLTFPALPEFTTRVRKEDGYGERVVNKYRELVVQSIYESTNKNLEETARLMGWTRIKTLTYLESSAII